jgi:isoleucyl-tRNA synthetase
MRKEADFEVTDKIVVYCKGNNKIADLLNIHKEEIQSEVLALEVKFGEADGYVKDWNINGEDVTLGVKRS